MSILVAGLGKVGLPIAVYISRYGGKIIGYDTNSHLISVLRSGHNPYPWERNMTLQNIEFIDSLPRKLQASVAYVIVPTPQEGTQLSSRYVIEACRDIRKASKDCLIVVGSTLDPHDVPRVFTDPLMAYSPPLIRLGSVAKDVANAEVALVGIQDQEHLSIVKGLWHHNSDTEYIVSDPLTIAITKLAINTTLSMKVAWANELDDVARLFGADRKIMFKALHADPRIGKQYMTPGWVASGPCLPRDMTTWSSWFGSTMACAVRDAHSLRMTYIVNETIQMIRNLRDPRVAILGVTYNPHGLDITNSQGLALAEGLRNLDIPYELYDPMAEHLSQVPEHIEREFPHRSHANVVVITTPYPEYMNRDYGSRFVIDRTSGISARKV